MIQQLYFKYMAKKDEYTCPTKHKNKDIHTNFIHYRRKLETTQWSSSREWHTNLLHIPIMENKPAI